MGSARGTEFLPSPVKANCQTELIDLQLMHNVCFVVCDQKLNGNDQFICLLFYELQSKKRSNLAGVFQIETLKK